MAPGALDWNCAGKTIRRVLPPLIASEKFAAQVWVG